MDFFNRYNEEQNVRKEKMEQFETATKEYFSKDFKGFEFNLGEKTFRYNVKNVDNVIKNQGKLQGLVGRFLSGEDNVDYKNYIQNPSKKLLFIIIYVQRIKYSFN